MPAWWSGNKLKSINSSSYFVSFFFFFSFCLKRQIHALPGGVSDFRPPPHPLAVFISIIFSRNASSRNGNGSGNGKSNGKHGKSQLFADSRLLIHNIALRVARRVTEPAHLNQCPIIGSADGTNINICDLARRAWKALWHSHLFRTLFSPSAEDWYPKWYQMLLTRRTIVIESIINAPPHIQTL